jgi:hypothetical protein
MWGTAMLGETKKRTLEQADIDGLVSLYGQTSSIAAPVLSSPFHQQSGVATSAQLTWNPAAGATSYDVYLGTSASPALVASVSGTSYMPAVLTAGVNYYWRVVARNGSAAATSPTWSFTTAAGALTAPVLLSPAHGATGVSLSPTLQWSAVAGATAYDVYLGTTTSPIRLGSISGTSVRISGLRRATVYYWKIVARSGTSSASSAQRSFRTY